MHNPLATYIMYPNTIHGLTAQAMVSQHHDRFWTSLCFDDFHRRLMNLGLKPVPLGSLKLSFHPCKERPKWTLYVAGASFFVHAGPGHRGGLELDLGLHLGDSNRISFRSPSYLGNQCWSSRPSFHPQNMVVCMEAMFSSV